MALFLETFPCERCGKATRRVDREDVPAARLCGACSDELTAQAAAAHDTLLWVHRRQG
jgi:RNA polymerase-binding transcription factor DksA